MKRVVFVIAPEVFRDEEYAEPKVVLESADVEVVTASTRPGECVGRFGMKATATISVSDALADEWDAAAFIGGAGSEVFFDDDDAHRLARQEYDRGGIVAAICAAPVVLANAGLLDGIVATGFAGRRGQIEAGGATWSDGPVVVEGRIVTASGPEAATAFGETLVEMLGVGATDITRDV